LCSAQIHIPLIFGPFGNWLINVTSIANESTNSMNEMMVHLGETNIFFMSDDAFVPSQLRLESVNDSYTWSDSAITRRRWNDRRSLLGIGPASTLTRATGSLAVIRRTDSANLVIGSTFHHFNRSCAPNSIIRVRGSEDSRIFGLIRFQDNTVTHFVGRVLMNTLGDVRFFVPEWIKIRVIERLHFGGARGPLSGLFFSNCILDFLPNVQVDLVDINGHISKIIYYPEDYIEFNGTDCRLLMDSGESIIMVDVLKIPNANVRISNDNIWEICDAI
jgi:hypothetical protein